MESGRLLKPAGRLMELLMRYWPAAIALSILAVLSASTGTAGVNEAADPRAQVLLETGRSQLASGAIDAAIDNFEAALAVDPGYPATYLALGQAARRAGLQGKAIHYFRQALAREPNNLAAISGEGGALAEKGAIDKAKANLARLQGLCGKACPEAEQLAGVIAKGPIAKVVTAEAIKPAPKVEAN
jgi:tetratricopeptide (TPR) repeat protein